MNAFEVMAHLQFHADGFEYGVVREDESVVAFGRILNGVKIRFGSISLQEEGADYQFLVLKIDNTEEFRAENLNQLEWFMWGLSHTGNWEDTENWVKGRTELVRCPFFRGRAPTR